MSLRKNNLVIAVAVSLLALPILAIGLAWAAPLAGGPVYLPYVPKQPTYTPTVTPTPTRTPTPTPTRTATPPVVNPIANPGFENGSTGWVFQSNQGDPIRTSPFAHTGLFSAALGNGNHNRVASISQQFTVPFNNYNLHYWQYIQSVEPCGIPYDVVTTYVNGVKFQSFNVCSGLNSLDWSKAIINLIAFRGQSIVFRMEFTSDSSGVSSYYVDDYSFLP